jgi:D-amino peptidase
VKVYISADIEGVAGITAPDEANPDHKDTKPFQEQMTREVLAACDGAIAAGAKEVWVKDAHWTGRNIDVRQLPECVRVIRGWSGHPYAMMQEIDQSFAAVLFVGYHARAGSGGNPLAHTMSGRVVHELRINGVAASEFKLNTFTATMCGVPAVFLSGDEALCDEVRAYNEGIRTVATFRGVGPSTVAVHPEVVLREIRAKSEDAVRARPQLRPLPASFEVELDYKQVREAYGKSFYPGAKLVKDGTVGFKSDSWMEALRMIHFCIK